MAEEMSIADLTYQTRKHKRDLYEWPTQSDPPITHRLAVIEKHNKEVDVDLYDANHGLVPLMRAFFTIQEEKKSESGKQVAKWGRIIAVCAIFSPIVWAGIEHLLWGK